MTGTEKTYQEKPSELQKGHSMSNQHKNYLTLMDLEETWVLHSVC